MPNEKARRIVTHGGSAHRDELLACAYVLARDPSVARIERHECTPEDLADPRAYTIDVGRVHDPTRLAFDHHAFAAADRRCAFSLVLEYFGAYRAARELWPWLEWIERLDTAGPFRGARELGVAEPRAGLFDSPIDLWLQQEFAAQKLVRPGMVLWGILHGIGVWLHTSLDGHDARMAECAAYSRVAAPGLLVTAVQPDGHMAETLDAYRRQLAARGTPVHLCLAPDSRSGGFTIRRYDEATDRYDFRELLAGEPHVPFIHPSGFMAVIAPIPEADAVALVLRALQRACAPSDMRPEGGPAPETAPSLGVGTPSPRGVRSGAAHLPG